MIGARREALDGRTYWTAGDLPRARGPVELAQLLPIYDEYLVAYRDRDAVPHGPAAIQAQWAAPVALRHALIIGGQVAGTWNAQREQRAVAVTVTACRRLAVAERHAVSAAAARYARYLGLDLRLAMA
jgi:hypothetical protein